MRILQYNILNGCQGDPDRFARLGAWLKEQAYDVVGLNELNGWNQSSGIHKYGEDWGYPYAEIFVTKASPYFVGVLSRHPIEVIEKREQGFHHGALHIRINGIHYIITHLNPQDASRRELEAEVLAQMARRINEPLIVMGDMNTLSPLDRDHYEQVRLPEHLSKSSQLQRKFMADDAINYRPMQTLLDAGLRDLSGAMSAENYTVPTKMNKDGAHAAQMHLDYILANDAFKARSLGAHTIHNETVESLSDHYPVECSWE